MKNIIKWVITAIVIFIAYFLLLPPLNISAPAFWTFLVFVLLIIISVASIGNIGFNGVNFYSKNQTPKPVKFILMGIGVIFAGLIIINIFNSPIFNSKAYYERITIREDGDFTTEIPEVDFSTTPLLDKDSSEKLGDRVMGQIPDLVSQFVVSNEYTQVNYNDEIIRVTPLEYADLIKYLTNRSEGTAGYIKVDSVTGKAEMVRLEEGMKYMPSAILFEKLERKLRFDYPTEIFADANFEIDDEGKPYWIIPTIKYVGIGLRAEIDEVIVFDPVTGDSIKYSATDVPTWVDHVYPTNLVIEQVDNWGSYKNGFLNSIFGQREVVSTTRGYNYLKIEDDIYLYTGITSVVADESNIGFILSNLRTKETTFYPVSGAEEYSAMASAEGQVQHLNYRATFPLLINLNNKPTYFLSLKDNSGLVKMYAFIDVEDYQRVVVTDAADGIEKAAQNYLGDDEININEENLVNEKIEVKSITTAVIDGTTNYYITDTSNNQYKVSIKVNSDILPFVATGSALTVSYEESEGIKEIIKLGD